MRRAALLLLAMMAAGAAPPPVPPEPPAEMAGRATPTPPEKPHAADEAEAVPVPEERPAGIGEATPGPPEGGEEAGRPEPDRVEGEEQGGEIPPLPPEIPDDARKAQEKAPAAQARPKLSDTTDPIAEAACRIRLARLPAEWEAEGAIEDGRCGVGERIRLSEAAGLKLVPEATVNCRTAEALTLWLRDDVIPAAQEHLDEEPESVSVASSYVCRNRNGRKNGRISEHAFGNAIDVGGFVIGGEGVSVGPQDPKDAPARAAFQKRIRQAACDRFTTVLGPGADSAHKTHFHFDLRQRSRGYRLCQ